MGRPAWSADGKYITLGSRKRNEDSLEKMVAEWTSHFDAVELVMILQKAGVPSHVVSKSQDLFEDKQLEHRGFFTWMEHPEIGLAPFEPQSTYIMSETPRDINRPSPCLGEHNEYVLKEILRYSDEDISGLISSGAVMF
jgi:benzylsuccinate CoA-transferase BbsF subunit